MPIELQVIRANEFVRLDPRERLDLEASKQALQTLAQACLKRGLDHALLDLRGLPVPPKPLFTPTELAELVRTFRNAGFTRQQRLAVLYRQDVYGGIRNFAFFGRMRGLQVQAFTDFEEAFVWLAEAQQECSEHPLQEMPVAITAVQKEAAKVPAALVAAKAGKIVPRSVRAGKQA